MTLRPKPGQVLLASPMLLDPHFYKSVVLMVEANEEGAFGLVINHPLGLNLGEALGTKCPTPLEPQPLFGGGPVSPENFLCLHNNSGHFDGATKILEDLYIGGEPAIIDSHAFDAPDPSLKVRFFGGYSGWGAGQLEDEIKEGSWIIQDIDLSQIFGKPDDNELWDSLLNGQVSTTFSSNTQWTTFNPN